MPAVTPSRPDPWAASGPAGLLHTVQYRTWQFLRHLDPRPSREVDSALAVLLSSELFALVSRLPDADRTHLLSVHRGLIREGWADPDLLAAALLHDIGKADEHGRVGAIHRVVKVLLNALGPELLRRLARERAGWLRHGLYLSLNHARIGAEQARHAGASDRTCWLIAHHDDGRITGDPALEALRVRDARE